MKKNCILFMVIVFVTAALAPWFPEPEARANDATSSGTQDSLVLRPGVPIGFLGHPVGDRLEIEGMMDGFNTCLRVTKVNGKTLVEPIRVWTLGNELPKGNLRLVGFERPFMLGQAPAEIENGKPPASSHAWSLASEFVVLRGLPRRGESVE